LTGDDERASGFRDRIRELRRVPAERLIANPKNWRTHPKAQREAMRAVLAEIGYAGALLARETDAGELMLIDGHLRAESTPGELVPVLVLDVNEAEADKILLTFDPLSAMADLDRGKLQALSEAVAFDHEDLQELVKGMAGLGRDAPQDPIPPPAAEAISRPGDLWYLGRHRLLCGDSTKPADVARLMGDERAVLFDTDPPYLVGYKGTSHPTTQSNRGSNANKDWSGRYREQGGREADRDFYLAFIRAAVQCAIAPNAAWYCWHAIWHHSMLEAVWQECGAFIHQQIIWFKSRPVLTYSTYKWQHEPCAFGWMKGQEPAFFMWAHDSCLMGWRRGDKPPTDVSAGAQLSTVWEISNAEVETKEHPTAKPNRLFAIPMEIHTQPGDICYEPFSGSGSQLIAAEQMGRRCYAIELEPVFVDLAVKRWETLTGKKAERDDAPF